jgi:hypothetical protein
MEEDNDSVYEAIVSKKRARDNVMSEMIDSIKLITPEIIEEFMDYVKAEIVSRCDDPKYIKFEFEITKCDDLFIPTDPDDAPLMFYPLIIATKNVQTTLGLKSITKDDFYEEFTDTLYDYLQVLIDAWNQKHPKIQIKSEFCEDVNIFNLKNK